MGGQVVGRHAAAMYARMTSTLLGGRVVVATVALALLAVPLASAAEASIITPFTTQSRAELSPGITLKSGVMRTTGGRRQSVNVGIVDPRNEQVRLKALLSNDRVVRREVVSKIAIAKRRPGFRPMIATNGDMSTRARVDEYAAPHSMAVSSGELMVAQACARPTLGVDAAGNAHINRVRAHVSATPPGHKYPTVIHKVNAHRDTGHIVLYTKRYAKRTRTAYGGVEVVLDLEGKLRPNGTQQVRVLKVRRGGGNTPLRAGQAVLSVKNPKHKWVYQLQVGQRFPLQTRIMQSLGNPCSGAMRAAPGFNDIVEAQGGNYFTLRGGANAAPSRADYAPGSQRHPRTGLGVTADGTVLMVTVDGRNPSSKGVTLAEMGQLMKSLGAKHAFNLDGGGSTVMARFKPGARTFGVANKPSDGRQRPAPQAFAAFRVTPRG
jgi:hypothetical protein